MSSSDGQTDGNDMLIYPNFPLILSQGCICHIRQQERQQERCLIFTLSQAMKQRWSECVGSSSVADIVRDPKQMLSPISPE